MSNTSYPINLKNNCIEQTRKFFKSTDDCVTQIIKIIEDNFDSNIEPILQLANKIRKYKYSRFHTRISAIFFAHMLVFSHENSKFSSRSNCYQDISNYSNFIKYSYRNEDNNFMLLSSTDKYCNSYSKNISDFPLTCKFDVSYTLYVHDNIKTNNIIQKQDNEIDRLNDIINELQNECRESNNIINSRESEIRYKNIKISKLETQINDYLEQLRTLSENYLYYKNFFDKHQTHNQTNNHHNQTNNHHNQTNNHHNQTQYYQQNYSSNSQAQVPQYTQSSQYAESQTNYKRSRPNDYEYGTGQTYTNVQTVQSVRPPQPPQPPQLPQSQSQNQVKNFYDKPEYLRAFMLSGTTLENKIYSPEKAKDPRLAR